MIEMSRCELSILVTEHALLVAPNLTPERRLINGFAAQPPQSDRVPVGRHAHLQELRPPSTITGSLDGQTRQADNRY